MIWKIAKKEFLLNLMTFKFAVGTILCVVLMAVFMPVLVNDYQQRLKDYNANVAANEAELRKVKVYKNITPTVYRPPNVLSVFSEGLEKRLGNSAKIEFESVPEINMALSEDNPFLSIFPAMDVSLIFKIVVSILALLVAYDTISGERERGTLKLVMSSTLPRYQVLLGKLFAGLITLAVLVTIAFIFGLLILELSPMVNLASSDWARIGLIYVASLVFISAMFNFGLLFSCLAKKSAISLMWVLLFWVIFVIIIPNGSVRLATQTHPLQPREVIDGQIRALQEKLGSERHELIMALFLAHKSKPAPGRVVSGGPGAFGRGYAKVVSKPYLEERLKRETLPLKMEYADKIWMVEHNYLRNLLKQKYLAKNLSRVSPISLYGNVMSTISGSDLASFQYFVEMAKTYRNQVVGYIRTKTDNFTSASTITACSEEDMIEAGKRYIKYKQTREQATNEAQKKENRDAWVKWIDTKAAAQPSLNLQDLPRFISEPAALESFQRSLIDFGLLIFISVLFFVLSFVAFTRYDVRSD